MGTLKLINGRVLTTYKAKLIKTNQPPKYEYNVLSVSIDTKYKYFVVTIKIYRHEFIKTYSFDLIDRIELYEDGNKKPIQVIEHD